MKYILCDRCDKPIPDGESMFRIRIQYYDDYHEKIVGSDKTMFEDLCGLCLTELASKKTPD